MQASTAGTSLKHLRLKRGLLWLGLSSLLTFAGIGGWLVYSRQAQQQDTVAVATVESDRGTVEIAVNASGNVTLGQQQQLKAPSEVTVEQVRVAVGDRVTTGQELILLRSPTQSASLEDNSFSIRQKELALERSREQVTEAQEQLAIAQRSAQRFGTDALKLQQKQLELDRSQQKVLEAEADLEAVAEELGNLQVLAEKGFIAQTELDQEENNLRRQQASLQEARTNAQAQGLGLQIQVLEQRSQTEAETQIQQAEAALRQAQNSLAIQQQELEQLRVGQQQLIATLQNNIIRAPFDGKVLSLDVNPGDGLATGSPMLTLGDPEEEIVRLQLPPLEAAKVQANQPAEINLLGPDALSFPGQVLQVSPQAMQDNSASFFGGAQAGVEVKVGLNQASGVLIPGSPVEVKIIIQAREDVTLLPIQAVQTDESGSFVWQRDGTGKAQKQPVELGLESIADVEIKSGLTTGEVVLLPDFENPLSEGQAVDFLEQAGGENPDSG